jgi:predicted transcriptional regulator
MQRSHISKSEEIPGMLKRIEEKIDIFIDKTKMKPQADKHQEVMVSGKGLDIVTLLSFPDHLRKSAMAIMKLGKAMAEDVAKITGRARAVESAYLNQLSRMGYVKKNRKVRRMYFFIEIDKSNSKSDGVAI